ncbi:YebC/PmpR family DNA-binding transcriptional regulator [Patescibacteria group bacterium]|nr:YebC/PmpR family DNA-binding transcriptional regulator [Patescibacteria group bacterium]MCL5010389.1 YebC/PmpR family DNA-binding transcriptional regulator [Patescibacteria group bacterium]
MSGHSKWAQIKRQKGNLDIKRGQIFTKLANAITISVSQGGRVGDPNQNPRLRLMIEKAKAENMPKERIARAIERGLGRGGGSEEIQEVSYEAFGPGGAAFIIEAATDNSKRSLSQIKNILSKNGGALVNPGSVSYLFETTGEIIAKKDNRTLDDIFLLVSQSMAQDIEDRGEEVAIYTKPEELTRVKEALSDKLAIDSSGIIKKPLVMANISDPSLREKVMSLKDELEALDDVQNVYTNLG